MRQQIKTLIQEVVKKLYPDVEVEFTVDYPPPGIDADFASNVALVLAKRVGKNPMDTAGELSALGGRLRGNDNLKVSIAAPGFMNFKLSEGLLVKNLNEINKKPKTYGASNFGKKKLAIVEYFQLNVAKPPHVGHLRSAVIGDSLKRILRFVGYKTVSDTHLGDWGTQVGVFLASLKKQPESLRHIFIRDIGSSARIYAEQSQLEEEHDIGKEEFVKLEKGNLENREYWKELVKAAKESLDKHAKQLGLLPFDYNLGESFYEDKMPAILNRLEKQHLLKKGETGEKYVDLEKYGLGRLICVKSDGATTYELRDLATLAYRYNELAKKEKAQLSWNLYVVDTRQSHDFKQIFKTMELLGYNVSKSVHVDFGFMSLPEGPMSTRKGTVISLELLLKEAKKRALQIIKEKNPELKRRVVVAEQVALAAIKYGDLKHNRKSDIVFDWDETLSFEGNTGPYLQYTYARLKSILRKAGKVKQRVDGKIFGKEEAGVLRKLSIFPDIVLDAAAQFLPSVVANYLFELSSTVNNFYQSTPVLQEKEEAVRATRLAIVDACADVLKNGLNLLGIEAPEEM